MSAMLWVDQSLSRRLERAEAEANIAFVEARAAFSPDVGSTWIEWEGTFAMFDGPVSPCTQTFCLGLSQPATRAALEEIEAFFREHRAPVFHEVSPLGGPSVLAILNERGYKPMELTSVLFRELTGADSSPSVNPHTIRLARPQELDQWAEASVLGWTGSLSDHGIEAEAFRDLARAIASRENGLAFLMEDAGAIVATGSLAVYGGVALLAGASTVPDARRRGAQQALVEHRLRFAAQQGCDLAMMCAQPGSSSQRNAERNGFRIAYTRIKWQLLTGQS